MPKFSMERPSEAPDAWLEGALRRPRGWDVLHRPRGCRAAGGSTHGWFHGNLSDGKKWFPKKTSHDLQCWIICRIIIIRRITITIILIYIYCIYILPIVTNGTDWWVLQPLTVSLKKSALEAALPPAPVPQVPQVPQVGSHFRVPMGAGRQNSKKGKIQQKG